jgi:hypothetical protein
MLSSSSRLSKVVRVTPVRAAKTKEEADLQGLAKMMRHGSTPRLRTVRSSSIEAQSKPVPRSARSLSRLGSGLHFTAAAANN